MAFEKISSKKISIIAILIFGGIVLFFGSHIDCRISLGDYGNEYYAGRLGVCYAHQVSIYRDNNRYTYKAMPVSEIDADSVVFLNNNYAYAKDSDYVYTANLQPKHEDSLLNVASPNTIVEEADPATFEIVSNYFAKDKDHVYHEVSLFSGLSANSIEEIFPNSRYVRDASSVYYDLSKLEGADPQSFVLLSGYGIDAKQVYRYSKPLEERDVNSFEVLTLADGELMWLGKDSSRIDIKRYRGTSFTRDKNAIYYLSDKVEGINIEDVTFSIDEYSEVMLSDGIRMFKRGKFIQ